MSRFTFSICAVVLAFCVSCKQQAPKQAATKPAAAGPQMQATVVTIRTTIEPAKQADTFALVISGDRARSTGEQDTWRLFDLDKKTITFVDDVAKTVRVEKLQDVVKLRRAAINAPLPSHYARLKLVPTGTTRAIQNVNAKQNVIAHGGYKRELWLAEHPAIPKDLFAMMTASERASTPLAPMSRAVDDALLTTHAFPLLDRSEIAYGNQKMIVERAVVSIEKKAVQQSLLAIPRGYEDVTPKPKPPTKK
jgi:hypothetical protein